MTNLTAWFSLSSGYVGAALFGALLIQVGRIKKAQNAGKAILGLCALSLLLITVIWGWHDPFTLVSGLGLTTVLGVAARFLRPVQATFCSLFLAVQCCLNAISDFRTLLVVNVNPSLQAENDALFMQQQYLIPSAVWAVLWAAIGITMTFLSLRSYWRATAKTTADGTV